MTMQPFFRINAAAETSGNQEDTVEIFGVIGDWWEGNDDSSFVNRVKSLSGKALRVQINSFGGDLKAGLGIANFLRGSGKEVTTVCMGVAASAASLIFCAGSKRIMRAGSQLMIHNSLAGTYGQKQDMIETAKTLDGFDKSMAEFYSLATGKTEAEVQALMDATTWMRSDLAVELGFATEREPALKAVACAAPDFAYAFKNNSNVMSSASLTHPALLEIAALLPSTPESEADLIAGVKNFASELSSSKADLVTARASIQSLTARAEQAEKATAEAQKAAADEVAKVKASVDEEARKKAAEIVQAAALPSPVKDTSETAKVTAEKPAEQPTGLARFIAAMGKKS
jgi:ATP-dependent protease ClpP protease subunit